MRQYKGHLSNFISINPNGCHVSSLHHYLQLGHALLDAWQKATASAHLALWPFAFGLPQMMKLRLVVACRDSQTQSSKALAKKHPLNTNYITTAKILHRQLDVQVVMRHHIVPVFILPSVKPAYRRPFQTKDQHLGRPPEHLPGVWTEDMASLTSIHLSKQQGMLVRCSHVQWQLTQPISPLQLNQ